MNTFTAILIDDEQAAHYAMQVLLKKYNSLIKIIGQAYNGKQAVELINSLNPNLIFLDIQMPDMNGFEVLKHLTYQPYIIFCTAYDQYAIEAFKQNSIDYLLKPIDEERFEQCITKIERFISHPNKIDLTKLIELSNLLNPPKKATAIPINIKSKIILVQCEKIVYCMATDGYVSLITDDGKEYISDLTLKQLEDRLPNEFIRVQKSYIVNKQKIVEIHRYFNNRLILVMEDSAHTKITTGTSYIDVIRNELQL
ncbi:LytTR family DNA-binding domain-containing protein [Bacteroides sp. 519]|uniref:LytR/AlgR family response regulator transcription factor n=1 Tax=Bacteroides sp. 519 TaxID=2302937 RepID=UPI0013D86ABA|nr:LytTR family DNA-binding domain-containing protein [Bacteroides sp. 519]NDV60312.1 DNA-binding response regulator [Bacteroides sp. 519]